MYHLSKRRLFAGAIGIMALAALPLSLSTAASAASPHIRAVPNHVMVNTDTHLIGTHFGAHQTLTLAECSETHWIAPQDPCDSNTVTVTTDAKGRFATTFLVKTCPGVVAGTSEKCYVGVPTPTGVDTIELLAAAKITVTGP